MTIFMSGLGLATHCYETYVELTTSEKLTTKQKVNFFVKGLFSLTQFSSAFANLGDNLNLELLAKRSETFMGIANLITNIAADADSPQKFTSKAQIFSKYFSQMAHLVRNNFELETLHEKKYLEMSDEMLSRQQRPIYEIDEDGYRDIIGYKPVTREECENLISSYKKVINSTMIIEVAANTKVMEKTIEVTSDLIDLFNEFRDFYKKRHAEKQENEIYDNLLIRQTIPKEFEDDPIFKKNICPITLCPIRFPVLEPRTKVVYEKAAIEEWIQKHHTSPFTRDVLNIEDLEPMPELQKVIDDRLKGIQEGIDYMRKLKEENKNL